MTKGVFFTVNDQDYNSTEFISQWYDVSSYNDVEFIVLCDKNYTQSIEFAMDLNFQIVNTVTMDVLAGTTNNLSTIVKTRYARFLIENITSVPCDLECQAFYYN